ncbi:type III secretion apparatus [Pandoraea iniqua]|uniref:Type III secretion apparatus n=2 Tax=Pandoraea iniqua TaxID=2508288 RepID=A0A5E4T8I0_9BURK|nr:type III secretion apparatus [Pandoraea iniqua]
MSGACETMPDRQANDIPAVGRWLDASTRQTIVELAFAGACHGMAAEARAILDALPALVDDVETRQWLHTALLMALGDVEAAHAALVDDTQTASSDPAATQILHEWLAATAALPSGTSNTSGISSTPSASSANDASRNLPVIHSVSRS